MAEATPRVFLLELNEINFDFARRYAARGKLPNLPRLIADHGIVETSPPDLSKAINSRPEWSKIG